MTTAKFVPFDPKRDLLLERVIDVPSEKVWAAWTRPEHLRHWFVPRPWTIADCEIDLRPGGVFRTVMRSPEGEEFPNSGCYLEIVTNERLVWTSALVPGFRPATVSPDSFAMTAIIMLEPAGSGTRYTAHVLHGDEDDRKRHEDMGFHEGWGTVADQLVEYSREM